MNTCETCRYWSRTERTAASAPDYDPAPTGQRMCARIVHGGIGEAADHGTEDADAVLSDGSGYAASLYTRPNFGCLLYESKP